MSDLNLPKEISPDGREIWDWAGRFSRYVHLKDDARKLSERIRLIQIECGSCAYWMTSRCPREVPTNRGYSRGPSCADIKCTQFMMNASSERTLKKWHDDLQDISTKLAAARSS